MTAAQYKIIKSSAETWTCTTCIPPEMDEHEDQTRRSLKWGNLVGLEAIRKKLMEVHNQITTWKNNMFKVPGNATGKELMKELTRLVSLFNTKSCWEPVAIHFFIIFLPLMLQKPSSTSKTKDHVRYLKKRLSLWKEGNIDLLMSECEEVQSRLKLSARKQEDVKRGYTKLMMFGKVKQAMKLIDCENNIKGVHKMDDRVKKILKEKHPEAAEAQPEVLENREVTRVEEIIFEEIDASMVQKSAKDMSGSGGPTRVDADQWKHILCSKVFGKLSIELAEEIAILARRICVEDIPHEYLQLLWDCRLVPLMKEDDGTRPVGIGETIRRIIGKCVLKVVGEDVQLASSALQTCAGIESGIEAAIHAMKKTFDRENVEAVMLVDADNAFNKLNRKVALHNIERTCPKIHKYLHNSYKAAARLHLGDGTYIYSEEGATQGDNLAMAMYSLSTGNIIKSLKEATGLVVMVWFADDSAGAGKLTELKAWWEHLKQIGPAYGYHPKASKTILILKSEILREEAEGLFTDKGITITSAGERHIGAVIGSEEFKVAFVNAKVDKWIKDLHELTEIAKEEPQVALSGYNVALSQRWKFLQRTVSGISHLFEPLEKCIREKFIPALCGREVSDTHRKIFALPYRYGGMGILNPVEMAQQEYDLSKEATEMLTGMIYEQELDLSKLDRERMKEKMAELKAKKEKTFKQNHDALIALQDEK